MRIDIKQLEFLHPKLRDLVSWLEDTTGVEFTVTSLYRIGDEGVHGTLPLRAIDLRMRTDVVGHSVEHMINTLWTYDPDRLHKECALFHGEGYNRHLHLQVCDSTVSAG